MGRRSRRESAVSATMDALPRPLRWAGYGGLVVGLAGAIAGLVVGLKAHPPTAVFAAFELGLPSAFLGCWFGLLCGAVASLALDRDADRARDTARGADESWPPS